MASCLGGREEEKLVALSKDENPLALCPLQISPHELEVGSPLLTYSRNEGSVQLPEIHGNSEEREIVEIIRVP